MDSSLVTFTYTTSFRNCVMSRQTIDRLAACNICIYNFICFITKLAVITQMNISRNANNSRSLIREISLTMLIRLCERPDDLILMNASVYIHRCHCVVTRSRFEGGRLEIVATATSYSLVRRVRING